MDKLVNERCSLPATLQIWFTKEGVANFILPDGEMGPLDGKKKEGTSAMPWSPPDIFYLDYLTSVTPPFTNSLSPSINSTSM